MVLIMNCKLLMCGNSMWVIIKGKWWFFLLVVFVVEIGFLFILVFKGLSRDGLFFIIWLNKGKLFLFYWDWLWWIFNFLMGVKGFCLLLLKFNWVLRGFGNYSYIKCLWWRMIIFKSCLNWFWCWIIRDFRIINLM